MTTALSVSSSLRLRFWESGMKIESMRGGKVEIRGVVISKGVNEIGDEKWKEIAETALVKSYLSDRTFRVYESPPPPPVVEKKSVLPEYTAVRHPSDADEKKPEDDGEDETGEKPSQTTTQPMRQSRKNRRQ
jgi:hypothetical protein